jgi:hypothetical protein
MVKGAVNVVSVWSFIVSEAAFFLILSGLFFKVVIANQLATHVIPENENTFIFANGDQKRAIFPFSYGVWITQIHGKKKAILGAVDNVPVNADTIGDGSFPFENFEPGKRRRK